MENTERKLKETLEQDIELSELVQDRLQQTYAKVRAQQKGAATMKTSEKRTKKTWHRVAAIAAAAVVACGSSVTVFAAVNGGVWDTLFGNSTKTDLPQQTLSVAPNGDKDGYTVTLPSKEFASVDADTAQRLLGDHLMTTPIVQKLGDHTLTVDAVVYDTLGGCIISFTMECPTGVTNVIYDKTTNQGKGAHSSWDSRYLWNFSSGAFIYVDTQKSTKTKLYCTAYGNLGCLGDSSQNGEDITLYLAEYSIPLTVRDRICQLEADMEKNGIADTEAAREEIKTLYAEYGYDANGYDAEGNCGIEPKQEQYIQLTDKAPVKSVTARTKQGASLQISPIAMTINATELGIESLDGPNVQKLEIRYKDGSRYVLQDKAKNLDNTGNTVISGKDAGSPYEAYHVTFNRLVDTAQIAKIVLNGDTVYTL